MNDNDRERYHERREPRRNRSKRSVPVTLMDLIEIEMAKHRTKELGVSPVGDSEKSIELAQKVEAETILDLNTAQVVGVRSPESTLSEEQNQDNTTMMALSEEQKDVIKTTFLNLNWYSPAPTVVRCFSAGKRFGVAVAPPHRSPASPVSCATEVDNSWSDCSVVDMELDSEDDPTPDFCLAGKVRPVQT